MNVVEIVRRFLSCHGYDGLQSGNCCCEVSDLAPCGDITGDCEAGFKISCPPPGGCRAYGDCDFHIQPGIRISLDHPSTPSPAGAQVPGKAK